MARVATPRRILVAALVVFLVYAFPGYVGWDTEAHLLEARAGVYTDAHPPAIAALWRLVEIVVTGPLGMLLVQAIALLAGLYLVLGRALAPRAAAIATAAVFVFPPVCGVTALVVKDALMAGFIVLGVGLVVTGRRALGVAALVAGSAMRWNAFVATCAPVVLLLELGAARGWRRYGYAAAAWLAITATAFAIDTALADRRVYSWYGTHAYQDIAGTLRNADAADPDIARLLDGVPLAGADRLRERIAATYDAADYRQLTSGPARIFEVPRDDRERAAVRRAWSAVVFGYPVAYLRYRWDNFRDLLRIDTPRSFAHVYVWFHVIATPESVDRIEHDAAPSKIQDVLRGGAIALSNTPLYYPWIYLALALAFAPWWRRDRLAAAFALSGIAYELAWFFLNPTGDFRYSQWLVVTTAVAATVALARRQSRNTTAPSAQRAASQPTIA